MRARHVGELGAPAWSRGAQFRADGFYGSDEVYGHDEQGARFPVYGFDPATYVAARTDQPQWLVITFPRQGRGPSWGGQQVFDQMVDHFDFAYARDTIFHPERVAGRPYRPR